jgi:hypothetical protein
MKFFLEFRPCYVPLSTSNLARDVIPNVNPPAMLLESKLNFLEDSILVFKKFHQFLNFEI